MIGVALVARHVKSKLPYCLKCMSHDKIIEKNLGDNIRTEIQLMLDLAGKPHIMPLLKIINRPAEIVLVFPYVPGRDLFRFMRSHRTPKGYLTEYETHVVFK